MLCDAFEKECPRETFCFVARTHSRACNCGGREKHSQRPLSFNVFFAHTSSQKKQKERGFFGSPLWLLFLPPTPPNLKAKPQFTLRGNGVLLSWSVCKRNVPVLERTSTLQFIVALPQRLSASLRLCSAQLKHAFIGGFRPHALTAQALRWLALLVRALPPKNFFHSTSRFFGLNKTP